MESVQVDPKALEQTVRFLTSISPPRQYLNQESMFAAESFVQAEFEKLGYAVSRQEVRAGDRVYHNLIARYGDPNAKEVVVIGAHYDVCEDQPGADDNASGVAGLLELARLFKQHGPKLSHPVEFVVYSLEEPPFFGSQQMGSAVHAAELKKSGVTVKYMVSLEMIGYFSDQLFSQKLNPAPLYLLYPWTGDFIAVIGSTSDRELVKRFRVPMSANSGIPVVSINAPRSLHGLDFSDHRNYWSHDWPAIMITDTAFLRNEQYHQVGDTPDRLNFNSMAEVVRGVYAAICLTNEGP